MRSVPTLGCDPERACLELAALQHGVITRRQALELGMSRQTIDRRLRSGRWRALHPGIYAVAGMPSSRLQTLMGVCLWGGGATAGSHGTAASLLFLDQLEPDVLEVTSPRRLHSPRVIVHRGPFLSRKDIVVVDGIPLTNATLTIVGLAAVVDERALEMALDAALRKGVTTVARLRWRLQQGTRGLKGARTLKELVDARRAGTSPAESPLELKVLRLFAQHCLPAPARQLEVRDDQGRFLGRVDLAYPEARVAIEVDGYRWHTGRQAWQRDLKRRNALVAQGWQVLHITSDDVRLGPQDTVAKIRRILRISGTEAPDTRPESRG